LAAQHQTARRAQKIDFSKRGEIYLVSFDPSVGSKIQKTRPALVIQNDVGNRHSPITIMAAITSKFGVPSYPTEVILEPEDSGMPVASAVLLNQIRSMDKQRLIKRIGKVNREAMQRVDRAISVSLGLVEI
jgi:mRNA interferase MazF